MIYGISFLNIIPLRGEANDRSEMVSQILFGEFFKVLDKRKNWSKIRLFFDSYEGWIDTKHFKEITKEQYDQLAKEDPKLSNNLIESVFNSNSEIVPVSLGAQMNGLRLLNYSFEGIISEGIKEKNKIIRTALNYLNTPYLWGGKSAFGIDCSGFTQMVYKLNGYKIFRDAYQQANQGEALSFIEESEPGDLAFFDNDEGHIIHVGIIMEDNYIIHAHGHVRIDRIDHFGIYNVDKKTHTHKLRVIKKII